MAETLRSAPVPAAEPPAARPALRLAKRISGLRLVRGAPLDRLKRLVGGLLRRRG